MKKSVSLLGAMLFLSLVLTACGQPNGGADSAGGMSISDLAIRGFRGTDIAIEGNKISARGANEGLRGIAIAREGAPVLVRFNVKGRQTRLRVRQGGQTFNAPLADEGNAIMLGTGGAASAVVFTRREDGQLTVRISSVTDCQSAPAGACAPMQVPPPPPPAGSQQ